MTDELDEILNIHTIDAGNRVLKLIDVNEAKQAIQALIDRECNKARIEELERQEFQDVMMLYAEYETREVVKNRIAELSNKENTNE